MEFMALAECALVNGRCRNHGQQTPQKSQTTLMTLRPHPEAVDHCNRLLRVFVISGGRFRWGAIFSFVRLPPRTPFRQVPGGDGGGDNDQLVAVRPR